MKDTKLTKERLIKFLKDLRLIPFFLIPILVIAGIFFVIIGLSNDSGRTNVSDNDNYLNKNNDTITATIVKSTNEQVSLTLEVAETEAELEYGLMNRTFLGAEEGMLFIFPEAEPKTFWMKNTYIQLDIIFVDEEKIITQIYENTEPLNTENRYPSIIPVRYAIEVNGGWTQRNNVKVGDLVLF